METGRTFRGFAIAMRFAALISGEKHEVDIVPRDGRYECRVDGSEIQIDIVQISAEALSIIFRGKSYEVRRGPNRTILVGQNSYEVDLTDPRSWRARHQIRSGESGPQKLAASMPGKVVRVLVEVGAHVQAGEGLVVIEAMKMQNEVRAPREGRVTSVPVHEGQAVNSGEVVAIVE